MPPPARLPADAAAGVCPHRTRSLLLIRLCLVFANVWMMVNAVTGIPLYPSLQRPGYIALDGAFWCELAAWLAGGAAGHADAGVASAAACCALVVWLAGPCQRAWLPLDRRAAVNLFFHGVALFRLARSGDTRQPPPGCMATGPQNHLPPPAHLPLPAGCCGMSGASPSAIPRSSSCGSSSTAGRACSSWSSRRRV